MELKGQRGVALVDVLVSMVLLVMALLSILPMFITTYRTNAAAFDYTSINEMARDKLEQLMNVSISDPVLRIPVGQTSVSFTNDLPGHVDKRTSAPSTNPADPVYPYQRTWTVECLDVNDANTLLPVVSGSLYKVKRISVTVTALQGTLPGMRLVTVTGLRRNPNPIGNFQ